MEELRDQDMVRVREHVERAKATRSDRFDRNLESIVGEGESQRRPGLHTEGFAYLPHQSAKLHECVEEPYWHAWGFGHCMRPGLFSGGSTRPRGSNLRLMGTARDQACPQAAQPSRQLCSPKLAKTKRAALFASAVFLPCSRSLHGVIGR